MKHGLDSHAHLDSPLHRWEPRAKLIGLLALIFTFALVREPALLPALPPLALALLLLSRLPLRFALRRLRYPGIFILFLLLFLPLFAGESVLWSLGPLAVREEGIYEALGIAARFVSIVTVALVLFGTTPVLVTLKALRALGVPALLADMALFTYRYLYELGDDFSRMRTATRLRGFRPTRPGREELGALAALSGSLLVRSYERSERVYSAMNLRGHGQAPRAFESKEIEQPDILKLCCALALALALILAEVLL